MLPARKLGLWLLEEKKSPRSKWESYGRIFSLSQEKKFVPRWFPPSNVSTSGHAAFSSAGAANHWAPLPLDAAFGKERVGVWSCCGIKRYHKNHISAVRGQWGTRECWMPGKHSAFWMLPGALSGQCDWTPCLSSDMLPSWLLSLQPGKETAERSNHLLCLYLALECLFWRQSNENHPKEVLCWWENYERPKKGVIKKFAVQVEL